eukprot:CAMPEP_0117683986 /NCGR_PEP_ID=MMETSP0804-20121206/20786_1 /TAXON_ID=1074897 /ORGANISM="Tetraselmis astigmatica, Strain CCMP880" /LENGTH=157 /DNA_ID=CAMNT_0005494803 /DNA_START=63 /DNA_END=536 /DNA_ORIENTATION=-
MNNSSAGSGAPLQLECLNHVSIPTNDVERAKKFYKDIMAFRELERPQFGFGGAWMLFPGGTAGGAGMMLHIVEAETDVRELSSDTDAIQRSYHLCFQVVDVQGAKAVLRTRGIKFSLNSVPGTEMEQVFFFDPDGNGIELSNTRDTMPSLLNPAEAP